MKPVVKKKMKKCFCHYVVIINSRTHALCRL